MSAQVSPGFVIKTKRLGHPRKVFINICGCDLLGPAQSNSGKTIKLSERSPEQGFDNVLIPYHVLDPQLTRDNKGAISDTVDVIVHPEVVTACHKFGDPAGAKATQQLAELAIEWIGGSTDLLLDAKNPKRINAPYKGKQRPVVSKEDTNAADSEKKQKKPLIEVVEDEPENGTKKTTTQKKDSGGLKKGFLLGKDSNLYGPEGSSEGVLPPNAGDPLGWMPEKLRNSAKVIDTAQQQQQQQSKQTSKNNNPQTEAMRKMAATLPDELKNIDMTKIDAKDFMKDMQRLGGTLFGDSGNLFPSAAPQQQETQKPSNKQPPKPKPETNATTTTNGSNSKTSADNVKETKSQSAASEPPAPPKPEPPESDKQSASSAQKKESTNAEGNKEAESTQNGTTGEQATEQEHAAVGEGGFGGDPNPPAADSVHSRWSLSLTRKDADHPLGPYLYVNVCQSTEVGEMDMYHPGHNAGYVPVHVSHMEDNVVDMVVHPGVLTKVTEEPMFKEDFIAELCAQVQNKLGEIIVRNTYEIGGALLSVLKGEITTSLATAQKSSPVEIMSVETENGCVVVTAKISGCSSAKGVDVVLEDGNLSITAPGAEIPVCVALPCKVDEDAYTAKFVKKKNLLKLRFPAL